MGGGGATDAPGSSCRGVSPPTSWAGGPERETRTAGNLPHPEPVRAARSLRPYSLFSAEKHSRKYGKKEKRKGIIVLFALMVKECSCAIDVKGKKAIDPKLKPDCLIDCTNKQSVASLDKFFYLIVCFS